MIGKKCEDMIKLHCKFIEQCANPVSTSFHLEIMLSYLSKETEVKDKLINDMADIIDKIKKGKWVMYKDEAEKLVKKAREINSE